MSYFAALGGTISNTDWCSARNQRSKCSSAGPNLCRPLSPAADSTFRAMQKAVNQVASVKGFSPIRVDGDVGPETVSGVVMAINLALGRCDAYARDAENITQKLLAEARRLGASTSTPAPSRTRLRTTERIRRAPETVDDPEGSAQPYEPREAMNLETSTASIMGAVTSPIGLAALGAGALGVWWLVSRA